MNISFKTGIILTFIIGTIYSTVISIVGLKGWTLTTLLDFQNERLLVYFMVFLLGALCNKYRVLDIDKRNKRYVIISNLLLWISLTIFTVVAINLFLNIVEPGRDFYFLSSTVDRAIYYGSEIIVMLSFIYIFIDLFKFNINKNGRLWTELNKNSYYVYIIHMLIIGLIALPLTKIDIPTVLKYFILTILTFIISNTLVSIGRRILSR